MIISKNEQGTEEWLQERCIIPTASEFSKIITPTGKPSTQAKTYMATLLASWYLGKPADDDFATEWMMRGNELEDDACRMYEFVTERETNKVGLIYKNQRKLVGASPDRIVGPEGLLEIKCPKASTFIGYLMDQKLPDKYRPQVQGQLWVTNRKWCDFMVYHPEFEPIIIRVNRDNDYIKSMDDALQAFINKMLEGRKKLSSIREAA